MGWAGRVARVGDERYAYRILVGRPVGKRQLGRPKRRWEDNIKMDRQEVGCKGIGWIDLAQDTACECGNETFALHKMWKRGGVGGFLTSWGLVSFSGRTLLHHGVSYSASSQMLGFMQFLFKGQDQTLIPGRDKRFLSSPRMQTCSRAYQVGTASFPGQ